MLYFWESAIIVPNGLIYREVKYIYLGICCIKYIYLYKTCALCVVKRDILLVLYKTSIFTKHKAHYVQNRQEL